MATCKKDLYFFEGGLFSREELAGRGKLVFKMGEKYETICTPYASGNGLEFIVVHAVSDGKVYEILSSELNYGDTSFALEAFDFSEADDRQKDAFNIAMRASIVEQLEICKRSPNFPKTYKEGERASEVLLTPSEIEYTLKNLK